MEIKTKIWLHQTPLINDNTMQAAVGTAVWTSAGKYRVFQKELYNFESL